MVTESVNSHRLDRAVGVRSSWSSGHPNSSQLET